MSEYNFYCDESCHLEHDESNVMVLGAVWCPKEKRKQINECIKQIKKQNGIPANAEIKWTKVAPSKKKVYEDVIRYFFEEQNLHFRGLLVSDKKMMSHEVEGQSYEDWYYRMYFSMLKGLLSPSECYNIFIDIKDTHSSQRSINLQNVIRNSMYDFSKSIVKQIKPIRSEEVQIMQITDILTGALGFANRLFPTNEHRSEVKQELVSLIKKESGYTLQKSTLLREEKFNLFIRTP